LKIKHHHYDAQTIQRALKLLIGCSISFRGIEKVFELLNEDKAQATPSYTGIRKWFGRMGMYELNREKEQRNDWIFIVDFTIELGRQKALVVLGVSQEYFLEKVVSEQRGLSHNDVEILGIEIMNSTKGELIEQQLDKISERVGVPVQIVADNGSDLARGIKLYQQKHPEVIYTHDVTHAMALLLKNQLNSDDRYQSFIKECNICRQRLQQTELSFLAPPTQRSQCRYFNVERLTQWAINLLKLSPDDLIEFIPKSDRSLVTDKLIDKLGWLISYESELIEWNRMVLLTRSVETHLKRAGISYQSPNHFEKERVFFLAPAVEYFQQQIFHYLNIQSNNLKNGDTLLATSDVIESLFGKYKLFSSRCPIREMGQTILTICLSTMNLTTELIKDALESVSFADVEDWLSEVFGRSTLSKRTTLFRGEKGGTKTA
jgi:hypothetical protein